MRRERAICNEGDLILGITSDELELGLTSYDLEDLELGLTSDELDISIDD